MIDVAIVGGGPAGSHCAYILAENGVLSTIFDHSHPREKPCGGLISPLAQELFPFLRTMPVGHSERKELQLLSPSGQKTTIKSRRNRLCAYSRSRFDQYLLKRALAKDAVLIPERAAEVARHNGYWRIRTSSQIYDARILVGADGVNSLVRKSLIGPLKSVDKGICYGYFVKGLEKEDITMIFSSHRRGYMWIIPRDDHTCVGIGSSVIAHSDTLKIELDAYIKQHYAYVKKVSTWTALTPNIKAINTFNLPLAGSNWLLIGDAAGHVNPIMGEGIIYALLDGELAAQAIIDKNCQQFDMLWRKSYGQALFRDIALQKWLYSRLGLEYYCLALGLQNKLHL